MQRDYINYAIICVCVFGSTTVALWAHDTLKRVGSTVLPGAPRWQINFADLWRCTKTIGLALAASTGAWLYSDYIPGIDQGTRAGVIRAAIAMILAAAIRMLVGGGVPPAPPQPSPAPVTLTSQEKKDEEVFR